MSSIRKRLFAILLAATGVVWLSGVLWIQHSTRTEIEHVLDRRLQESAQMVASLINRQGGVSPDEILTGDGDAPALPMAQQRKYARQLICQVWGLDGRLISESDGAPDGRLAGDIHGFSENAVNGEVWRVYTHIDDELGIRVMVGDARAMRDRLIMGVTIGVLAPAILILPFLALLIWWAVGRGLAPLQQLADTLAARKASDFSPLPSRPGPDELRPMVDALNDLLGRAGQARERERTFTAFAAHELKTPLAGIKTHAQIAKLAPDEATRAHALAQIDRGVSRTDRMARQLLDMTAVENTGSFPQEVQTGAAMIAEIVADLSAMAEAKDIRVMVRPMSDQWQTEFGAFLMPGLRNLMENAIQASPEGAGVEVGMQIADGKVIFSVADRGPGIPDADRPHVAERFFRGTGQRPGGGSGLGLAIVTAAAARMGGELRLSARAGGGELAELILPAA